MISGLGRTIWAEASTEAQIIAALKQVEAGRKVEDVARECSISKHKLYAWKAKYGGLEVNQAQRLRSREDENSRLKRLVANLSLDREMLKAVISEKGSELVNQRTDTGWLGISSKPASAGSAG